MVGTKTYLLLRLNDKRQHQLADKGNTGRRLKRVPFRHRVIVNAHTHTHTYSPKTAQRNSTSIGTCEEMGGFSDNCTEIVRSCVYCMHTHAWIHVHKHVASISNQILKLPPLIIILYYHRSTLPLGLMQHDQSHPTKPPLLLLLIPNQAGYEVIASL